MKKLLILPALFVGLLTGCVTEPVPPVTESDSGHVNGVGGVWKFNERLLDGTEVSCIATSRGLWCKSLDLTPNN